MKKYLAHVIWAVVAIAAFVGGMFYGKATAKPSFASGTFASSTRGTFGAGGFRGGAGGAAAGQTVVAGQILSMSGDSMTVQLQNGNSEVVLFASSTSVTEPTEVSLSKISTGQNVTIIGSSNSDGSVTATSIQVRNGSSTFPGQ